MLDRIIFQAPIKPYVPTDIRRFYPNSLFDGLSANVPQRALYFATPLTNAQMEITPFVSPRDGWLWLKMEIFVAAALVGQNWIHGGLECLRWEVLGTSLLARIILTELLFDLREIEHFRSHTELVEVEFSWQRATTNQRAAHLLFRRVERHFRALTLIKSRHDIQISQFKIIGDERTPTLYVTFSDHSVLRFYLKREQLSSRLKGARRSGFMSQSMRDKKELLLAALGDGVRCEPILSAAFLSSRGMSHPTALLDGELVGAALSDFRHLAFLDRPFATRADEVNQDGLSDAHLDSLARYFKEEDALAPLSSASGTRHRNALLSRGVDLAVPFNARRPSLGKTLWKQIWYDARLVPGDRVSNLYVGPVSGPDIERQLLVALQHAQTLARGAARG